MHTLHRVHTFLRDSRHLPAMRAATFVVLLIIAAFLNLAAFAALVTARILCDALRERDALGASLRLHLPDLGLLALTVFVTLYAGVVRVEGADWARAAFVVLGVAATTVPGYLLLSRQVRMLVSDLEQTPHPPGRRGKLSPEEHWWVRVIVVCAVFVLAAPPVLGLSAGAIGASLRSHFTFWRR